MTKGKRFNSLGWQINVKIS